MLALSPPKTSALHWVTEMRLSSVTIALDHIGEEEREAATRIVGHVLDLELRVFEFRAIVGLFEHVSADRIRSSRPKNINWGKIGRTGAIAASTFWQRIQAIKKIEAPNIWSMANISLIDEAIILFRAEFPGIVRAPEIAAILADPCTDASNPDQENQSEPALLLPIGFTEQVRSLPNMLKYTGSLNKEKLVCGISFRKAEALDAICELCKRAFRALEPEPEPEPDS